MLQASISPLPSISVSFAHDELHSVDPKFSFVSAFLEEPDSPPPQHLLPPSSFPSSQASRAGGEFSLMRSPSTIASKSLKDEQFEAMLRASRERSAMLAAKKPVELRKEIAMKVQKAKQCERRARFLSKLVAPPSPTAAALPVTPPDSPAVFHFSLPSPGMLSPLEVFEDIANHPELYDFKCTIEQVDFRLPQQKLGADFAQSHSTNNLNTVGGKPSPSLEQISQRLGRSSTAPLINRLMSLEHGPPSSNRLPSFLRSRMSAQESAQPEPPPTVSSCRNQAEEGIWSTLPPSPSTTCPAKLQVTITVCPPTQSRRSPTKFTEANVAQFGIMQTDVIKKTVVPATRDKAKIRAQRIQASKDLLIKLGRRTAVLPGAVACGIRALDDTAPALSTPDSEDKHKRRWTAPAEMCPTRRGARHPVLERVGGF